MAKQPDDIQDQDARVQDQDARGGGAKRPHATTHEERGDAAEESGRGKPGPIDPDAPARGVLNPEGPIPEPNEPA